MKASKLLYILPLSFALLTGCTQVPSGSVGVKRVWGKIDPKVLSDGLVWLNPFSDSVEQVSTRLVDVSEEAHSASRDLQNVDTKVTITFNATGEMAPQLLTNIGNLPQVSRVIISPAIQECVKAITAGYSAEDLIKKRPEVKSQIEKAISDYVNAVLTSKGIHNALNLRSVAITDFNFSHEFNQAIESKVKAEQDALRALNDKTKRITDAEASAAERKLAADAEAYSNLARARAEAESITATSISRAAAIQRESEALAKNPNIIELRKVEKWNGTLPMYTLGGGAGTLIQLPQERPSSKEDR
ncbi:MAG: prohibitin family protein [Chthoniobacterales bacterium]